MSYSFYIGSRLLPVAPSRLEVVYGNKLKKVDLAKGEEVVFSGAVKSLTEVRFTALLPQAVYPFAVYKNGFVSGGKILQELLDLKASGTPFRFIVFRKTASGKTLASTNIRAVFSEIRVLEDAANGSDISVDVRLSEYRDFAVKNVQYTSRFVTANTHAPVKRPADTMPSVKNYRVDKGDTLWMLAQRLLGDGNRYKEIYNVNKSTIDLGNKGKGTSTFTIFPEQMLNIPKR